MVEGEKAIGIQLENGEERLADLVVFDADPPKVYRDLIDATDRNGRTEG